MSDGAFHAFLGILRPRLPRPGLFAEVRTALALRYMNGGSYVDMRIVANGGGLGGNGVQFGWEGLQQTVSSSALRLE